MLAPQYLYEAEEDPLPPALKLKMHKCSTFNKLACGPISIASSLQELLSDLKMGVQGT